MYGVFNRVVAKYRVFVRAVSREVEATHTLHSLSHINDNIITNYIKVQLYTFSQFITWEKYNTRSNAQCRGLECNLNLPLT